MNLKDIYIINLALDAKQIFSMPDFFSIKMTNLVIYSVIDKLVTQGLLVDKDTFSQEGIKVAKRIYDFKKSKKYIKMGNLVFGLIDNNSAILLKRNFEVNDYSFERININNCVNQLIDEYPFLNNSSQALKANKTEQISYEELISRNKLDIYNCLYISSYVVESHIITDEMVFCNNQRLYLYNRKDETLEEKSSMHIQKLVSERMVI